MKPKHKSPGKRLLSLLFCLLLTLQMVPGTADAVLSGVYFVAVNYDLMDLNQETMPFWSDGQLYVSHAAFSGSYGSSLGVSCSVNSARRVTVLYTLQNALFFDTGAGSTYDNQGNTYTELAIEKNGYVFLPIRLVTSFFGLTYSYRQTETIPLIRIKTRTSVLSDDVFIDAAATLMRSRYKEYEESLTAATPPTVNTDPDDPAPTVYEGQRVYLVFRFTDRSSTLSLLSSLNRYQKQATFLMTPQQMEENHDLLRQLVGGGHAIAIAPTDTTQIVQQLEQANQTLQAATHTRTRLVWLDGKQSGLSAATDAGYCPVSCAIDYSRQSMTSSYRAENLYDHLSRLSLRDQTVWLGDDSGNTAALDRLLSLLQSIKCRVIAYRETL